MVPHEQVEHGDSTSVNVNFFAICPCVELLGRHIQKSAHVWVKFVPRCQFRFCAEPEVYNANLAQGLWLGHVSCECVRDALSPKHNILRFDISVDQIECVHFSQTTQNTSEDRRDFVFWKHWFFELQLASVLNQAITAYLLVWLSLSLSLLFVGEAVQVHINLLLLFLYSFRFFFQILTLCPIIIIVLFARPLLHTCNFCLFIWLSIFDRLLSRLFWLDMLFDDGVGFSWHTSFHLLHTLFI